MHSFSWMKGVQEASGKARSISSCYGQYKFSDSFEVMWGREGK